MQQISFSYKPTKRKGEAKNPHQLLFDNILKMLNAGGLNWTYSRLCGHLRDLPDEWLRGWYRESIDAQNPAKRFLWRVKESKK